MQSEPRTYSPLEPNYLRRYKLMPDRVKVKWDVECEEPRRYVEGGIGDTFKHAREEAQAAIDRDLKRIAESFGL